MFQIILEYVLDYCEHRIFNIFRKKKMHIWSETIPLMSQNLSD